LDSNKPEGFPKEAVERLLEILKKENIKNDSVK
jgi:hypothetical protein